MQTGVIAGRRFIFGVMVTSTIHVRSAYSRIMVESRSFVIKPIPATPPMSEDPIWISWYSIYLSFLLE